MFVYLRRTPTTHELTIGPPSRPALSRILSTSDIAPSFCRSLAMPRTGPFTYFPGSPQTNHIYPTSILPPFPRVTPSPPPDHGHPCDNTSAGKARLLRLGECGRSERRGRNGVRHLLDGHVALATPDRCHRRTSGSYTPTPHETFGGTDYAC
jgi:hypothetical protein